MIHRGHVLSACIASLGVFVITVALLPSAGVFTHSNFLEHFINSRTDWELPFLFAGGGFLVLLGLAGLFRSPAGDATA